MRHSFKFLLVLTMFYSSAVLDVSAEVRAEKQATKETPSAPVTFNRDIAPIIFRSCSICHRPGEAGPFPLLTYQDVKKHAGQIAAVTKIRFMPPWLPEHAEPTFEGEMRLSEEEINSIRKWVDQGALEGEPSNLPATPKFVEGWQLGTPDMVLRAEKPFALPAEGSDQYWNFVLRLPISETRWVKAVEIRPGDKRLVHHANILVDRQQSARSRESEPGAGFGGMELSIESETFDPDSHFLFWKPGTVPYTEPDGMALRVDKGTDLILNMHLQPSGKPELVQPSIGLYFTDRPATVHPMLLQLENDAALDIPPGDKNFVVRDDFTLPDDVDLLAVYPHAHYLGKDLEATAKLPDGTYKSLIHIRKWDLNWQAVYRYEQPVFLPRGSVVSMRYIYDNSAGNVSNPNHPPARVVAGNRSSDEMAHLWLQVLPRGKYPGKDLGKDPRRTLQEALARHNIDKNPADFEAHYNLAAMLQARGETTDAIRHYERAHELRPDNAIASNSLGTAYVAAGNADGAIQCFKDALRIHPDYFDAHYNLGTVLASKERFEEAVEHFRAAAGLHPDDADAEANLGSALAMTGLVAEAKSHLERALQIQPDHSLARENLEQLTGTPK